MKQKDIKTIADTSTALLEYADHILYVHIKEGSNLTEETLKEQFKARALLVGDDSYAVLVYANVFFFQNSEVREFMAKQSNKSRKAFAIVTNKIGTKMLATFFTKINNPKTPSRVFEKEDEAIAWLRKLLDKK